MGNKEPGSDSWIIDLVSVTRMAWRRMVKTRIVWKRQLVLYNTVCSHDLLHTIIHPVPVAKYIYKNYSCHIYKLTSVCVCVCRKSTITAIILRLPKTGTCNHSKSFESQRILRTFEYAARPHSVQSRRTRETQRLNSDFSSPPPKAPTTKPALTLGTISLFSWTCLLTIW